MFQRDLTTKVNDAHYVCLFLFRLHSDLQNVSYEHQSIDEVAIDIVSKLRNNFDRYFSMKQVTKQH